MDESHDELLAIADAMDRLVDRARQPDVQEPLGRLEDAANEIGRSFSGSWLGYHANIYYKGLQPPPPGAHFSRISGLRDRVTSQTTGDWLEFDPEVVEAAIYEHAGHPDMEAAERLRVDAVREFDTWKLTALSVIESVGSSDTFLTRLGAAVQELRILHSSDVINAHRPSGQLASLDMLAAGQGLWTPPHISLLARVHAVVSAIAGPPVCLRRRSLRPPTGFGLCAYPGGVPVPFPVALGGGIVVVRPGTVPARRAPSARSFPRDGRPRGALPPSPGHRSGDRLHSLQ